MGNQAGGNSRFKGPGALWKTGWKRNPQFSQLCCVEGFDADAVTGQFYENTNGPLPITPASGFFLAGVLAVSEVPGAAVPIARNGGVANEGWLLEMLPDAFGTSVVFRFTVYDGAGIAAQQVGGGASLAGVDPRFGITHTIVSFMVGFEPPSATFPRGEIGVGGQAQPLATPYVNSSPSLTVGIDSPREFPSCIVGLVGGVAPWSEAAIGVEMVQVELDWQRAIEEATPAAQVVAVPDTSRPGLVNTHGWRIDPLAVEGTEAPNPLADFVDAEPLVYGNTGQFAGELTIGCISPVLFWGAETSFPYTST